MRYERTTTVDLTSRSYLTDMSHVIHVTQQELSAGEILDVIHSGGRVVIELSVLGKGVKVVIREQDGIYYCDTPVKLFRHDRPSDLARCLEKFRLSATATHEETDPIPASA